MWRKPGLVKNVCKTKKNEFAGKVKTKNQSLKNVASQFGVSVCGVNNILKRKHAYENVRELLG